MPDVVAKVKKLLELAAASPSMDEARTAAVQAAKLIKKHGLEVREAFVEAVREEIGSPRPPAPGQNTRETRASGPQPPARGRSTLESAFRAMGDAAGREVGRTIGEGIDGILGGRRRRRR